jgi:hypothetical protein
LHLARVAKWQFRARIKGKITMGSIVLRPSAHPSSWQAEYSGFASAALASRISARDAHRCRFCSYSCKRSLEIFFLDGDRANLADDNLVAACLLCAAVQHPLRSSADLELLPVWLPEMGQRALNVLVRGIHFERVDNNLPAAADRPPKFDTPIARATCGVFIALAQRAVDLQARIGLRRPSEFAALFLRLDSLGGRCPDALAKGLRFLHRGRHFAGGKNIYDDLVKEDLGTAARSHAA